MIFTRHFWKLLEGLWEVWGKFWGGFWEVWGKFGGGLGEVFGKLSLHVLTRYVFLFFFFFSIKRMDHAVKQRRQ